MCITDLDGTLLGSDRKISEVNLETLRELGERGILRVLATGRSLWSLRRVMSNAVPFDYVIFATGAGIMDWRNQELIYSANLNSDEIMKIYSVLEAMDIDYMIHHPVPDTHYMHYCAKQGLADFWERIAYYKAFSQELDHQKIGEISSATQAMAIIEGSKEHVYHEMVKALAPLTTIRTTSPIDFSSLWIEIFSAKVSKGRSISYLASSLGISIEDCMVIGNDYNDEDMLALCPNSYVTDNAPADLKAKHRVVTHHDDNGFDEAVAHWLVALDQ
jgi:Cof subfamily protein (haloacid dehalogenase superfamily)